MKPFGVGCVLLLLLAACESGQTGTTAIDDRPPPFRDHGWALYWSTDESDQPTDEWFYETILEFRLPMLLGPSEPPSGAVARVSLNVHNVGFDRFVDLSINIEDMPWLTVSSSNQLEQIDCGQTVVRVTIRGTDGCFGIEKPGTLMLSWEEEWVHQARWRQDESAPIGQHLDFFRDWLNGWTAHRFGPA